MLFAAYLDEIRSVYATGVASEHSYRPALLRLFHSIDPALDVINEPRRVEVGAPDFIFQRGKVGIGWCEHKDIDKDVRKPAGYSKEQKERYRKALPLENEACSRYDLSAYEGRSNLVKIEARR